MLRQEPEDLLLTHEGSEPGEPGEHPLRLMVVLLRRVLALLVVVLPLACSAPSTVVCSSVGISGSISVDVTAPPTAQQADGSLDGVPLHLVRSGNVVRIFGNDTQLSDRVQVDLRLLDSTGQRVGGGVLQVRMHERTFGNGPCAQHARSAELTAAAADGSLRQTG